MSIQHHFTYGPIHRGIPPHPEYGPAYRTENGHVYQSKYGPVYPVIHSYESIDDPDRRAASKRKLDDEVCALRERYQKIILNQPPRPPPVIVYHSPVLEAELLENIRRLEFTKANTLQTRSERDETNAELHVLYSDLEEERAKPYSVSSLTSQLSEMRAGDSFLYR